MLGLKRNETRGWPIRYRGPLVIHAAQRWHRDQVVFSERARSQGAALPKDLPLGAVVGVAWVVDCRSTTEVCPTVGFMERMFGNYGPNRYAWLLEDAQPLTTPLPWKGKQGFFDVPVKVLNPLVPDWFAKRDALQLASFTA